MLSNSYCGQTAHRRSNTTDDTRKAYLPIMQCLYGSIYQLFCSATSGSESTTNQSLSHVYLLLTSFKRLHTLEQRSYLASHGPQWWLMVLVDGESVAVDYWGYVTPTQNNCLCSSYSKWPWEMNLWLCRINQCHQWASQWAWWSCDF